MANYQHILVAVDFSKEFEAVLAKAIEQQKINSARMTLVHVVEYTGAMYTGEIPLPEDLDLDQRLAKQAESKLQAMIDERQLQNTTHLVEIGTPKREIVRVAEEQKADLIIIGSHGRHGLQLLLGSTANGVLHLAKCDVLAIRVESD
ncbi:MAG: universal stress protein [Sedimenticola sp.]|nr:universal stress protein [Sedimenticola sp.]MCW8945860.1 universal stress protein [Sedimenticola sp.]MCW8948865.1 universal stress protein [Sedimenticola sp.]MCW8975938.1 universal stress protein [Sedimenticola sp.]MCW9022182.1 universal stress protein [Sedimenticola sp.]